MPFFGACHHAPLQSKLFRRISKVPMETSTSVTRAMANVSLKFPSVTLI